MKNFRKTIITFTTIFMLCIQYFFPMMKSLANETVDVNVMASPVIDIVLAKSKTKVDVSQFENDLRNELEKQNISQEKVKINAVEAVEANIQNSFNWNTDVNSAIGSIQITNNGQNIVMKGNKTKLGKNAMWIIPEKEQEQEINFDYSVDFGDSFNAAGMLLRVKQTGNILTGYMLSLNKSSKEWYKTAGNKYGAIWKFTYQIGTNTTNMTKTCMQGINIATSGRLNIKSTDTEIIISGGGLSTPFKYEMDEEYGCGFGFFSDHYKHNCSKIGAFTLGNIKLTTTTVKKFKEVLSNPEWRENSLRFLVNVDDTENEELKDKAEFASLQTSLINEQINPIFWGTENNKAQLNDVIQANNQNGTFIDNTDYTNAIKETAEYIKSLVNGSKTSQYAIVNEPVELKVTPESVKTNTITEEYPEGKWKINHDYQYFENNLGQFENSGKYMSDLNLSFDKTGRYEILYEDGKIASQYIYVHRKPVADFTISRVENNLTLTSTSYDLDCYSNENGIAMQEWKYKKVGEVDWHSGKPITIEPDDTYVVQLRVKDFQETWSAPTTKYIMYNNAETDSTPVAEFRFKNQNISKYQTLEVEDTSYDPGTLEITKRVWKVKKNGNILYTGETPLTDYSTYQAGNYTMSLVVTNEVGKESQEFSRPFQLIEDTTPPEIVATPSSSNWTNQAVTVDLKLSDKGGSKVKGYKYVITDSKETPAAWGDIIPKENDSVKIDTEGEKYLHVKAYDNAGNVSEDTIFGPYKIDLTEPEIDSIVPESKDWTNESIDISVTFSDKGGSGFLGYKYAVTTDKMAPKAWSEVTKEDKAKISITGEAEHYLHIVTYDNAGNESDDHVYGPYQLDKTSPKVQATPSFSNWTNQPVTVDLEFSDEGGSNFQKYQYAITNSGIMPEKWDDEIVGAPKPIVIHSEGKNYLHIIGYDNAGNDSSDQIFGEYKLDFTLPELINNDEVNSNGQLTAIKFTAKDSMSGVNKFVVNEESLDSAEYIVTKNGNYQFEILDNAGNKFTKNVSIDNIYAECNKNLEHPNYSSSYEKCPICDLVEGIKVTKDEKIYDGVAEGVSYENPQNAQIIEYYDGIADKPVGAGEYSYELKVMVDGTEYSMGIKGIFKIDKKSVDIVGLKLTNQKIDKTNAKVEGMLAQDKDYIELAIMNQKNYDVEGNQSITLKRDEDYQLKLREKVDESYQRLINCYELPETVTLTSKEIANASSVTNVNAGNDSGSSDASTINDGNTEKNQNLNANKKKTMKDKVSEILAYTGNKIEIKMIVICCGIVIFSFIFGKMFKGKKGKHEL